METYGGFARVYDMFMDDADYGMWHEYINSICTRAGVAPELVLDLGCGTGSFDILLADAGLEVIGVDSSEEMLAVARDKAGERDILFLAQDIREFELYGTVDLILSLLDTLNYITEEEELLRVFRLAANYLNPGGLFIFDMNTEYKFREILGENTFADVRDDAAYIWENTYFEEERINEFYMNFFIETDSGAYERIEECHHERAYSPERIKELVEESGLSLLDMYDAYTFDPPRAESERIFFVARKG